MKPEFPQTIDVNTIGWCNLACPFCWGPDHQIGPSLNTEEWKTILQGFGESGTQAAVFTGGEPTMRSDIVELLRFSKENLGFNVTLSTNGMFLERLIQSLPYLDQLGIPLDGSTPMLNAVMRPVRPTSQPMGVEREINHFSAAILALSESASIRPDLHLTVRTVVSSVNQQDIRDIGKLVVRLKEEEKISVARWKLYQFTPTGFYGRHAKAHLISDDSFQGVVGSMRSEFGSCIDIATLPIQGRGGRYAFVMPDGGVSGVYKDGVTYIDLGNALTDFEDVLAQFALNVINESHLAHGLLSNVTI